MLASDLPAVLVVFQWFLMAGCSYWPSGGSGRRPFARSYRLPAGVRHCKYIQEGAPTFAELVRRDVGPPSVEPPEEGTRLSGKTCVLTLERQRAGEIDPEWNDPSIDDLLLDSEREWTKDRGF